MNQIIETLLYLVDARCTRKDTYTNFDFTYDAQNQDDKYHCVIKNGIPETCAVRIYRGTGNSFDEAFENLRQNVVYDKAVNTEIE